MSTNMTKEEAKKLGYYFNLMTDGMYELIGVPKEIRKIEIPEMLNGIKVTKLGSMAFAHCYMFKTITIPENIKIIGLGAFYNCSALKSIDIPSSVKSIEDSAFCCCSNLENFSYSLDTELGELILENCSKIRNIETT